MKFTSALLLTATLSVHAGAAGLSDIVDTRIGSDRWHGSCPVGPCVPHGSVFPSPDTLWPVAGREKTDRESAPPSGSYPGDPVVGFSQLHIQGSGGIPTYGLFLVSPTTGTGETEEALASPLEIKTAHPHLFCGRLTRWETDVTIAPSAHGAVYVFDFAPTNAVRLVWNVRRKIGHREASSDAVLKREGKVVSGGGTYARNWNPAAYSCWFYAQEEREGEGRIVLRVAVSFRSVERAKAHFEAELAGRSASDLSAAARDLWEDRLGRIRIEGASAEERRRFYTHFYHTFVQPRDRTGDLPDFADGTPAWDDHYTLWDTWKTLFPLKNLVDPQVTAGVVASFAARASRERGCASAFIQGKPYFVGQGGDEADCIIADAVAKDVPGVDAASVWPVLAGNASRRTADYLEKGYVAADVLHPDRCPRLKSGSATVSFAFDDWCAAQVAQRLGLAEEAKRLAARAGSWTNVWDSSATDAPSGFTGFVRARRADGTFADTDPRKGYNTDFYEGTCWEYSFAAAPHDMPALVERMGGDRAFVRRLEYALGQKLVDFGNEPSFQTPWLFDFVGRHDLACKWADDVLKLFPESGCPGDDDSGAMGALYVFLTAGFYPLAGTDLYALHVPAVPKLSISLPSTGRAFTVLSEGDLPRRGERPLVVELNGRRLSSPFLRHADIVAGGVLRFL